MLRVALALGSLLVSCAPHVTSRVVDSNDAAAERLGRAETDRLWGDASRVFASRCVVCHGCYDAPCQLKLETAEGVLRGASPEHVYDSTRLTAAEPSRLGIDAHGTAEWRARGFHHVVPEDGAADPRASVLRRMLELKAAHPLSLTGDLEKDFTLALDRKESCVKANDFDSFSREHPLWGMPYALPGLDAKERDAVVAWIEAGAPRPVPAAIPAVTESLIAEWETFLNDRAPKSRLVARYLYEHLFLASLHFPEVGQSDPAFYRLIRSRTAPGLPADEIPTRRPFDDPGSEPFFYRIVRRQGPVLSKTHMPYAFGRARLARYRELFLVPNYAVTALPSYDAETSANPMRAFQALPVNARYRFLLDEAEFTMMGFIKGPVCRGQVALNVIQERFWITFVDPDAPYLAQQSEFLSRTRRFLDLPAESGSTALGAAWFGFAKDHGEYVEKKSQFLTQSLGKDGASLRMIWDGDGKNANAALTVLRHFDSATVVRGLVGGPPKTAWVVDYPLLERIHYLLVAGFDVFGNVGHQVTTRLYMDFLRMEGEYQFLLLLPRKRRTELVDFWYRDVSDDVKGKVYGETASFDREPAIRYETEQPENELFAKLKERTAPVLSRRYDDVHEKSGVVRDAMASLRKVPSTAARYFPEIAFVTVGASRFTVLRDSAHTSVAHLFGEEDRRKLDEDRLDVVPGYLGAYPNVLFQLREGELADFVREATELKSVEQYQAFRARFGVSRRQPDFWRQVDGVHAAALADDPTSAGLFDLSRLEAF